MGMTEMLIRLGMAVFAIGLTWYQFGTVRTVDSERLLKSPRPSPFHLRWALPVALGDGKAAWTVVTWASLAATVVIFPGGVWAAALWCCHPWFRFMATVPVTVDAAALAASLSARIVPGWPAIILAAAGATVSEKVPVWQGLYTLRPELAFAGLCVVLVAWKWIKSSPREGTGALAVGRRRAMRWTDAKMLLLPWGAGLAALASSGWSYQEMAVVVVAYGQMLVAWDTQRMIGWAAPTVLARAAAVIPPRFLPLAVVASWCNPWASPSSKGQVMC